jgi:glucuronate isomerase
VGLLADDRLFPADPAGRNCARRLYEEIRNLPIISPHGHTDPRWYAEDQPFSDPATLFVVPDHYIFRMLYSQGVKLEALGVPAKGAAPGGFDPRSVWRLFAERYHLFRGTPTRIWLDHVFTTLFGFEERLSAGTADVYFDRISDGLAKPEFRPRALYQRFNIEVIATTDSPLDSLAPHAAIRASGWNGRVLPTYRPDPVVDPDLDGFRAATPPHGPAIWKRTAGAGRCSRNTARRRRTTGILPPSRRTFGPLKPRRCSAGSSAAISPRRRRTSFAARCSPRWRP